MLAKLMMFVVVMTTALGHPNKCIWNGQCVSKGRIGGKIVQNIDECREYCQSVQNCFSFTFFLKINFCRLETECIIQSTKNCPDCLWGMRDCGEVSPKNTTAVKKESEIQPVLIENPVKDIPVLVAENPAKDIPVLVAENPAKDTPKAFNGHYLRMSVVITIIILLIGFPLVVKLCIKKSIVNNNQLEMGEIVMMSLPQMPMEPEDQLDASKNHPVAKVESDLTLIQGIVDFYKVLIIEAMLSSLALTFLRNAITFIRTPRKDLIFRIQNVVEIV